jgi:hypothetical protein
MSETTALDEARIHAERARAFESEARANESKSRLVYDEADTQCRWAQTQQILVENIINLIRNGFTVESAIGAVTSGELTKLVQHQASVDLTPPDVND